MPANPPKQVVIGGIPIAICIDHDMEHWGEYRSDERKIILSARTLAKASTLRETLRHEMLHAALDISGVAYLKQFDEEVLVRCIDNIFHPAWEKTRKQLL
jgi:hypothetical protein